MNGDRTFFAPPSAGTITVVMGVAGEMLISAREKNGPDAPYGDVSTVPAQRPFAFFSRFCP